MQRRLVGSVIVVAVGLVPALIGGPLFGLLMAGLGVVALSEFLNFGNYQPQPQAATLFAAVVLAAAGALIAQPALLLVAIVLGVLVPLALALPQTATPGMSESWSRGSAGVMYTGLPVFAAVALRQADGSQIAVGWQEFASGVALGWPPAPIGLAWTLAVVLSTWAGDSAAYLAGRAFGRHKLAPLISPGKTVEGAAGGLLTAMIVGGAILALSGVQEPWAGALAGGVVGLCGQLGDLSESFLKRQAGVKDSGNLIPGHGGILDRIDALLFAFPAALLMVWITEGVWR